METIIKSEKLSAKVNSHGAELTSLTDENDKEYIWYGTPEIWNRHAPVLFPFICSTETKTFTADGKRYNMSNHGFARDSEFDILSVSESSVTYELHSSEKTLSLYPYEFDFCVTYSLIGNKLNVTFMTINNGEKAMYFFVGGHPGFNLFSDIENYYIEYEKNEYIEQDLKTGKVIISDNKNIVDLSRELFKNDVFIKENPDSSYISLVNRKTGERIKLSFEGKAIAVWSPYKENASFVCMEPWSSVPIYFENTKELTEMKNAIRLESKKSHEFKFAIEIN